MKRTRTIFAALIMSTLFIALPGCEKQGPAEKAGESIDNATDKLGEKVEDAGEAIQDAADGDK